MYVRRVGTSSWVELQSHAPFGLEAELEMLLAESPELLPGQPTNLAVVRQLHIPTVNGYLDLCGVAPDGTLYLVECKLAASPDIRRTVVGQLLAYAAGLTDMPLEDFLTQYARAAGDWAPRDPAAFFDALPEEQRDPDYQPERMRQQLADNLQTGRFRLVFAVDQITDELRRIVDYLHRQLSTASVSALEVGFSRYEDVELVNAVLHGADLTAGKSSTAVQAPTSRVEFDVALRKLDDHVQRAFRYILDASIAAGAEIWGGRKSQPTLNGSYSVGGHSVLGWVMSVNPQRPGFGIMWRWLKGSLPPERLQQLYAELESLPGAEVWQGVDSAWNYVNLLPAQETFRQEHAARRLMDALHRALGVPGDAQSAERTWQAAVGSPTVGASS